MENKEINIDEYVINSEPIPRKSSHKHLGIIINDKLCFSEQSNSIVKTFLKKWGYLNKLCSYANADIFLKLYKSYLLSLLEYANLCAKVRQ